MYGVIVHFFGTPNKIILSLVLFLEIERVEVIDISLKK